MTDEAPRLRLVHPAKSFECTDLGNAERLVYHYGSNFHYVVDWDEFIVWESTHWHRDPQQVHMLELAARTVRAIRQEAKSKFALNSEQATKEGNRILAWAAQSQANARISAMINLARAQRNVAISHSRLNQNRWSLNVKNGTVDLHDGKVKPHEPRDLNTQCLTIRFDRKAEAPRWRKFLEQILPDKATREFVQRYIGYCLTGEVNERSFVVFYGGGKNGKSVFLRVVQSMLADYARTCAPGLLMSQRNDPHPAEIADLFLARLAVASEVRKGRTFDEEKVKRLTGGDRLKARRMQENWWEFDPTHKLLLALNHRPRVADTSDSFWDRLVLVEFGVRISEKQADPGLGERIIKNELAGVLRWAVEGCLAWQKDGLQPPKQVKQATDEYRDEEDVIGAFLSECCVFDSLAFTPTARIAAAAEKWAADGSRYRPSQRDIADALRQRRCISKRDPKGLVRGWKGVRLA
jgi:putative DNA primase/helicase